MTLLFLNKADKVSSAKGCYALAAVQAVLGCALIREPLIAPYLQSGELVKLFDLPVDDGRSDYLCVR